MPSQVAQRFNHMLSLNDFERVAAKRLPKPIFAYISGATERNEAFKDNEDAFYDYGFLPRVLVHVANRSQEVKLMGRKYASPFGIAPMGICAMSAFDGDAELAKAAYSQSVPFIVSGSSLIPLERLIELNPDAWFQAYLPGDEQEINKLIDRVEKAGYQTLVITVDLPVLANRENNIRAGFSTPLKPTLGLAWSGLTRPRWLVNTLFRTLLTKGMPHFENSFAHRGAPIMSSSVMRDFRAKDHFSWDHIKMIRAKWKKNIVIKGILHPEDARKAVDLGVEAIVVSNHGGRQLDGAVSALRVLPDIVEAVNGKVQVLMDGGVRRGTDVLKAIALGADAVLLGRPFNYALSVGSQAGVERACEILHSEIHANMALLGINQLSELSADFLIKK